MFDIHIKRLDLLTWFGFKGKPRAIRNADGWSITRGPHGEEVRCDTLSCCHCMYTWEYVEGSGRLRGFCRKCFDPSRQGSGITCGGIYCWECVPFEQRLENIEAGRHFLAPKAEAFNLGAIPTEVSPGGIIIVGR